MRSREDEILHIAQPIISEQFHKSIQKTVLFCEQNSEKVVKGFLDALYTALEHAFLQQDRKRKNKIKYVQFSHLFSSLFMGRYWIRIDMLDGGFYSDGSSPESYWDAGIVYRLFEEDIREIRKELEQRIPRIREYEIDAIRYAYAPCYHRIAKALLETLLEETAANGGLLWEESRWEETTQILFGEYMGQADLLFTLWKGGKGG
ncbi:MAG: hypothetical protein SOX46_00175 [Clostridiaceae bacterium]|uniref:Uncharacterized protein n=2 Tax=Clostridium porci TaxID=2605778 RepID=A0A7X2TBQ8_9CLOT|nr:hypothetical protein [Clostridium porci]MDY3229997.1 hypothetical protein [Clostridiaceae bacterium]MSS35710.1 hypothetical protein [Clostridium porci]